MRSARVDRTGTGIGVVYIAGCLLLTLAGCYASSGPGGNGALRLEDSAAHPQRLLEAVQLLADSLVALDPSLVPIYVDSTQYSPTGGRCGGSLHFELIDDSVAVHGYSTGGPECALASPDERDPEFTAAAIRAAGLTPIHYRELEACTWPRRVDPDRTECAWSDGLYLRATGASTSDDVALFASTARWTQSAVVHRIAGARGEAADSLELKVRVPTGG